MDFLTKNERLLTALQKRQKLTAAMMVEKFGFSSEGSARGAITYLRQAGHNIEITPSRAGNRYHLASS